MKTIVSAAIAAILATTLPAQAAEETFGLSFDEPIIKDAKRQVTPGKEIFVKFNIIGKAQTITITGPGIWEQTAQNVTGDFKSLPFSVTNRTPAGNLTFKVKATSPSGKTLEDTIEFLNVGSAASPTSVASNNKVTANADINRDTQASPTQLQTGASNQVTMKRMTVSWVSPPFNRGMSTVNSHAHTTTDTTWQLEGSPVVFGGQLRRADETDGNPNGLAGLAPYLGLQQSLGEYLNLEEKLGITVNPWAGGFATWPLWIQISGEGKLGSGFGHKESITSDLSFVAGIGELYWTVKESEGLGFDAVLGGGFDRKTFGGSDRSAAYSGIRSRFPAGSLGVALQIGYVWPIWNQPDGLRLGIDLRPLATTPTPVQNKQTGNGRNVKAI